MKKNILKNQKGITLIILILTILVLAILAAVVIPNIDIGTDIRDYSYMKADIELLEDKILQYYNRTGNIPIIGDVMQRTATGELDFLDEQASSRDNTNYYQIDISLLNNITLNFGDGTVSNGDIYIINEQSHEVYYLKGVVYEGETYYAPFN